MPPNVCYLVLDCLRTDAITPETAPTLHELTNKHRSYEACVPPANWSLPSHASIFTGDWPHEHGVYHRGHSLEELPLIEGLADQGYRTIGLTSNIYFSGGQGFDEGFDEFYETRRPLNPVGLNPFSAVRDRQPPDGPDARTYLTVLGDALRHDRPAASLSNYLRAVGIELDRRYDLRERTPGLDGDDYGFLTRASARTGERLNSVFERHASADRPFFSFANLMDTHYPYQPPQTYFQAETEGEYDLEDLRAIDPDISVSWTFLNEYFADRLDESALELVRAAYRAEVRSVDDRVRQLLDALERHGIREETLVVITSDHGEVLGETDLRGERSMGHLDSLSEHLRTVPLILAHPEIGAATVEQPVSLLSLTDRLEADVSAFIEKNGTLDRPDDTIYFELPANPFHESSYDDYQHIPDWYVEREALTHSVLGIRDDWCVLADSAGERAAWQAGAERSATDSPGGLLEDSEAAVAAFPGEDVGGAEQESLSESRAEQLEDLGYL